MLICTASRSDKLVIEEEDFYKAKELLEAAEVKMGKTFGGFGRAKNSDLTDIVRNYIEQVGITTRQIIMQKFYRDVTPMDLSVIEQTLEQLKVVKIKVLPDTGDKCYEWIGEK